MANTIEKIISVIDTREYEEVGDKFKPIPGSGETRTCDRCGRDHEVHATVLLSDGSTAIVGTGCMKGGTAEVTSRLKKLTSASKRLASLRAELAKYESMKAEYEAVKAEIDALPLPSDVTEEEKTKTEHGREYTQVKTTMGNTTVWSFGEKNREQRYEAVSCEWRNDQMKERGITTAHGMTKYYIDGLKKAIEKVEDRINDIVGQE